MNTMKNFKNYFDFVRIKEKDFCPYKTKKCGRVNTLNYYLLFLKMKIVLLMILIIFLMKIIFF